MSFFPGKVRRKIFGISPKEATFERRGFDVCDQSVKSRLERIGKVFLHGYHSALEINDVDRLVLQLNSVKAEWQGFAFEGASMALALLDFVTPWATSHLSSLVLGPGRDHIYMLHVGVGWALARSPRNPERLLDRFDPLLRWLAMDGYGFHEGYFHWPEYINAKKVPKRFFGYARRAFDQGLGRSLWFVRGANVTSISATIAAFPDGRRADLWSGIGLACAYAGGLDRPQIELLRMAAGPFASCLAQGAAFAAKARKRAGNPATFTELACQVLCGLSADAAANITDIALQRLPADAEVPAYEVWRQRIGAMLVKESPDLFKAAGERPLLTPASGLG